jgi:hypothetical protein
VSVKSAREGEEEEINEDERGSVMCMWIVTLRKREYGVQSGVMAIH